MEWISSWIQGIIIAVIIGTIIEMILPEGNSKKYIKVVIGIYILCSIISPVITKITKKEIQLSNILNLEEYIETSNSKTYENLNNNQDNQIRTIYEEQLKQDMKEKIASKGYEVLNIYLSIANDKQYTIEIVEINVRKRNENLNEENVEKSNIGNSEGSNKNDKASSNEKNAEKSNINGGKNDKELVEKIEDVEIKVETENSKDNSNVQKSNSSTQQNQNNRNDSHENANNENASQENVNNESISKKEKDELKEYLSSIYAIKKENININ